jgi:uncharacterized membrane protein
LLTIDMVSMLNFEPSAMSDTTLNIYIYIYLLLVYEESDKTKWRAYLYIYIVVSKIICCHGANEVLADDLILISWVCIF